MIYMKVCKLALWKDKEKMLESIYKTNKKIIQLILQKKIWIKNIKVNGLYNLGIGIYEFLLF